MVRVPELATQELHERSVQSLDNGRIRVVEYRGRRDTGYFRFIGMYTTTAEYQNADQKEAKYLDSIMDTLCWRYTTDSFRLPTDW